jgi:hypothetical protein
MITIPDYGKSVEQVGKWIAAGASLTLDKTLVLEPVLPAAPDKLASVFEIGGTWDKDRGVQKWKLLLVTRAGRLSEARALALLCIQAGLRGYRSANDSERGAILNFDVETLPLLRPRDEKSRVILEVQLSLEIIAPVEPGVDLETPPTD